MSRFTLPTAGVIVAIALSGCAPAVPVSTPLPQRIMPAPDGLKIAESGGQEISFGRAQLGVENAINRLVGTAPNQAEMTARGCEMRGWKNGLKLVFDKGEFTGWIAGPPVWQNPPASAGNTCGWKT